MAGDRPPGVSRRDLLAGGLAAGLGAAGLAACGGSDRDPLSGSPTTEPGHRSTTRSPSSPSRGGRPEAPEPRISVPPGSITSEPPAPADYTSYVSRPDLTPPGVSLVSKAAWRASLPASTYLFAAPKNPLAANPTSAPRGTHTFPAGAQPGLLIADLTGEPVWFKPLPGPREIPFNFRVQEYKGRPVMTWFQGHLSGGHAAGGEYVLVDQSYKEIARVTETRYPNDLHEFILTPEGTALHTSYEEGLTGREGRPLTVGRAIEVDVASKELVFVWSCYPEVNPHLSFTPSRPDYFHINSIGLWPGKERNLLISSRNTCAVYLIDRRRNRVAWRLGGRRSDFSMGPGVPFFFQHDARPLADGSGLSLFDDASDPAFERVASGKVINLDHHARRATLRHRLFHTDHEFWTPSQGNVQLLGNGGHVVGWGYLPYFSAFAPVPEDRLEAPMSMDGRFPKGADSYRTFLFNWTGHPPASELRTVVRRVAGTGRFRVWVSWNGATEVKAWHVHAGRSHDSARLVATVPKRGFETVIDVDREGAEAFAVFAVDGAGRRLGRVEAAAT